MFCWGDILGLDKRSRYIDLTDEALVELSQSGDEYAFNVLAGRYLNTRSHNSTAAYLDRDDFVQEGMFGFLNAVRTYDSQKGKPFESYASVCMRNSIKNATYGIPDDIAVDGSSDTFVNIQSTEDPLGQIITSERLSEVLTACQVSLSSLENTVVFFRAGGMSYAEIGEKLGMTPKAVDNAVQRARRKLKQVITPEG